MNEILDRLGIYDLWAILIPGIIGWVSSEVLFSYLEINIIVNLNDIGNLLIILVGSYLLGTVLNDMGHIASKKIFYRKKKEPLYCYLSSSNAMLRPYEKKVCEKLLRRVMGIT